MTKRSTYLISLLLLSTIELSQAQCPPDLLTVTVLLEADLTGAQSWDLAGDSDNQTLTFCNPELADLLIRTIGWELVHLNAIDPSTCSQLGIRINSQYDVFPSLLDVSGDCGPHTTVHLIDITAENILADPNGCVTFEVFETVDNFPDAMDASITSGTFFLRGETCVDAIPTLGEWGIIILGLSFMILGVVAMKNRSQFAPQTK